MSYPQPSYPFAPTIDSDLTSAGWESDFPARVDGTEGQSNSFAEGAPQNGSQWPSESSATPNYTASLDGMDSIYLAQSADTATVYAQISSQSSSAASCHPTEYCTEQHVDHCYASFDSAKTFVNPSTSQQLSMSPQNAWESFDSHAQDLVNANMLLQFSMSAADGWDSSASP